MHSSTLFVRFALISFLLLPLQTSSAQEVKPRKIPVEILRQAHNEVKEGKYIPTPREGLPTSPGFRSTADGFSFVQVNVDGSQNNIVGDAANEPSLAVDPTNSNKMAVSWRQFDNIGSSFRQAGYAYSTNGGLTWTFPGVLDAGIFRSDPVLKSDAAGNFYYNSLTTQGGGYHCDVFKSTDGGITWDAGTPAQGGDKQWMVVDNTGVIGSGQIYSNWTQAYSICNPDFFTRSTNQGSSYENCVSIPGEPFWGTLDVGPTGELYVAGVGNTDFTVAKSLTARDSAQGVTWGSPVTVSLGGDPLAFGGMTTPNPSGLHGQTWVAVDRSTGPRSGYVYLLCSVAPFSSADPLDVMFARSTNGGATWSSPVRVNDDTSTGEWQWFGTMSVAPNGRIDVVWLDTRDNIGSLFSSLYYAASADGGVTWSANKRLSSSFNPHAGWPQQQKMGDYFDMVSDDSGAHLAWAATFNGEQDVYYGRITAPAGIAMTRAGISFGQTPVGSLKTDSLAIMNFSSSTVSITSVVSSDSAFTVSPSSATLPVSGIQKFHVSFSPSLVGAKAAAIVFTHDGAGSPDTLFVSGTGTVSMIATVVQDADGDPATTGDQTAKRWRIALYRDSISAGTLVSAKDSSQLTATIVQAGTYIVSEADSGTSWVRINGNATRNDTLGIQASPGLATFINAKRYSINVVADNGWNMVSVPVTADDLQTDTLFPSAASVAFAYEGTYVQKDTLANGPGYWVKFDGAQIVPITGFARARDTVDVSQGWNLIGTISEPVPVAAISPIGTAFQSPFFGYGPGGYEESNTLQPGKGYWVKVSDAGKIVINPSSAPAKPASRKQAILKRNLNSEQ